MGAAMILQDLVLPSRVHKQWAYCGMDSAESCNDKTHFQNYPYPISYVYNSRGFRDAEWPSTMLELQDAIWCIGDSFTTGIGQPWDHVWPMVLANRTAQRTINISMDGASNDWIFRRAIDVMRAVAPVQMVVMWSYTHRRESPRIDLSDEQRRVLSNRCSTEQDYDHWVGLSNRLHVANSKITQLTIPDFHVIPSVPEMDAQDLWNAIKGKDWPDCPKTSADLEKLPQLISDEIKNLHQCQTQLERLLTKKPKKTPNLLADVIDISQRLDWARDHHHFDILTAKWVVQQILDRLQI